jgi:hypothetical protein
MRLLHVTTAEVIAAAAAATPHTASAKWRTPVQNLQTLLLLQDS